METSGKNFKETGRVGTSREGEIYPRSAFSLARSGKHLLHTTSEGGVFSVPPYEEARRDQGVREELTE